MSFDYVKARATAEKLIAKFGQESTVIKKGVTGGVDAFGDPIADTADTVINGTITPLLQYSASEIDGESIQRGDGYVMFHCDTKPEINMQVTLNGKTLRIIDVMTLDSVDDINIYAVLQLRK